MVCKGEGVNGGLDQLLMETNLDLVPFDLYLLELNLGQVHAMQVHSLIVCHTKDHTQVSALKSQPGAHTLETSMCTDHHSLPHPYTPHHLLKPRILHSDCASELVT